MSVLETGFLGAMSGGFSASAGLLSAKLIEMGEAGGSAGAALITLGRQLKEGSITVVGASKALQELIAQGRLTPAQFFSGVIGGRFATAIARHPGRHAATDY